MFLLLNFENKSFSNISFFTFGNSYYFSYLSLKSFSLLNILIFKIGDCSLISFILIGLLLYFLCESCCCFISSTYIIAFLIGLSLNLSFILFFKSNFWYACCYNKIFSILLLYSFVYFFKYWLFYKCSIKNFILLWPAWTLSSFSGRISAILSKLSKFKLDSLTVYIPPVILSKSFYIIFPKWLSLSIDSISLSFYYSTIFPPFFFNSSF